MTTEKMKIELIESMYPIVTAIRLYHRHEVIGMQNIPKEGAALIVCNHSLATYDMSLLMAAIYAEQKRIVRSLIDHLFFKIPYLGQLMEVFGSVQGTPENAIRILKEGNLVAVAPGGMFEALRPSSQRYQIRWDRRRGFARLAMNAQVPVVLAACPKADDIYQVYPSEVSKFIYERFKVPFFIARGVGLTPLPRPVKLVHFLSEPIMPPKLSEDEKTQSARLTKFHHQLVKRMEELMAEAVRHRHD
jgi:1-acyl-sn-glycerol-3-phosphate acyltransferase